ncbi:hypothetical protein [Lactiplantibacillus plantarum]|uniref:hypothetical protein n=1 Tax=Lactiplantibacillus plantarum TaxID=1590 RepID=UPI001F2EAB2F|nr:hypothetical protein [Lactiplantibacillus plantarum]
MAKTLEFTINSPRQIKQGDTETTFTFICKSAGSAVELTHATNITAKIGNASGYLRSQPIAITSLVGLSQGWLNLQPMPDLISGLPAGDYQLEIWVVDQAGTSIYPSDEPLGFTITNNIESESGASITTIAFDDFVEAMNKAASTIAKGEKGDPGPTPDLSNYTTVTDLNNGLSTKVTDNKNGTIEVNGSSITPANDSKVLHSTITQLNSTDMNTVLTAGYYQSIGGTNGISGGDNWTIYQVIPLFSQNGVQLAYVTNNTISGIRCWNYTGGNLNFTSWVQFADDSKVAHLSGANNFDTVPTYGTNNKPFAINDNGATSARPTGQTAGYQYFDTSLNKPIWYTGKNWVDATGKTV